MKLTLVVLVVLVIAGLTVFRLAPSDPETWHVDPTDPAIAPGHKGFLLRADGDAESPVFAKPPAELLARLDALALATPRTQAVAGSVAEGRITYVTRSRLFGFPDYTTVTAVPDGEGARLVIWARNRFGQSDLGVNAARVQGWLDALGVGEA